MAAASSHWWQGSVGKIVCIGRNYVAHVQELNNKVPTKPFWFLKPTTSLIPSGAPHQCPPGRAETHHEVELGVVIGERARRIQASDAMRHVAGFCLALDMTDREGQAEAKAAIAADRATALHTWVRRCEPRPSKLHKVSRSKVSLRCIQ